MQLATLHNRPPSIVRYDERELALAELCREFNTRVQSRCAQDMQNAAQQPSKWYALGNGLLYGSFVMAQTIFYDYALNDDLFPNHRAHFCEARQKMNIDMTDVYIAMLRLQSGPRVVSNMLPRDMVTKDNLDIVRTRHLPYFCKVLEAGLNL